MKLFLVLAVAGCTSASPSSEESSGALLAVPASEDTQEVSSASEDAQLQQLYEQAIAEGGELTIYAGGDKPTQQDDIRNAFTKRFPRIKVKDIVDFSKVHDARVDNQIAEHRVLADVVQFQTYDDFPRWKREGSLLKYKPVGWNKVFDPIKDKDGYFTGLWFYAFANVTATSLGRNAPVEAKDFLKPEFKDKLIFTYPNDDDAVLFYFKQLTDKYGSEFLHKLLAQNPKFIRGTQDAGDAVGNGKYVASFGVGGALIAQPGAISRFTIPKTSPWVAWAQTGAILKDAPHKAAAKLYLSWALAKTTQENDIHTWSARSDVAPPSGYKSIWDYPNLDPLGLPRFLSDRTALDRYKALITLYFGDVKGDNPNGDLGLYPGAF
ncbi:ABC transporter substrate-binding protein [Pendulispora albinea]|uniref:ABC transporter substrate-binding protein n=1 Tax=Pendulispora albinea TaxID=2741071 RepID=A0ABZ2M8V9_9BACT